MVLRSCVVWECRSPKAVPRGPWKCIPRIIITSSSSVSGKTRKDAEMEENSHTNIKQIWIEASPVVSSSQFFANSAVELSAAEFLWARAIQMNIFIKEESQPFFEPHFQGAKLTHITIHHWWPGVHKFSSLEAKTQKKGPRCRGIPTKRMAKNFGIAGYIGGCFLGKAGLKSLAWKRFWQKSIANSQQSQK